MASLAAILAEVYALTNRPDLVLESTTAVKKATLQAHQSDFFWQDLTKVQLNLDPTLEYTAFVISTNFARFRAFGEIYRADPTTSAFLNPQTNKIKLLDYTSIFDGYSYLQNNVAWAVTGSLNVRSYGVTTVLTPVQTIFVHWYQNPDITNAANLGWISDSHPYAIIVKAAQLVFKTIGQDQQAAYYKDEIAEQYAELKISNITAQGS